MRKRPLLRAFCQSFSQGLEEEVEAESAASAGSDEIGSQADMGLHKVHSFWESGESHLNSITFFQPRRSLSSPKAFL
jgi:hypothetical protein